MKKNSETRAVEYSPETVIKSAAYEIGFSEVGITDIKPSRQSDLVFDRWIAAGHHGEMRYLDGGKDKRHDPSLLLDGAKSVICVALNYYSESRELENRKNEEADRGVVSVYAHGRDYHDVIAEMLDELAKRLVAFFPKMRATACVDTQPISERDLAIKSGIAWLGKNTMAISPEFGSWVFLGELITNLELKSDRPLSSLCGTCTRCMDACPTGALDEAYLLDATKCISYLTIEKKGEIPPEFHEGIGANIFGCDECQKVCPFNAAAVEAAIGAHEFHSPIVTMELDDLCSISDEDFLESTCGSAIRRCKAAGLRRNARIVRDNVRNR